MMMMNNNHDYDNDDDEMGDLNTFDFDAPGISCLIQSTLWGDLDFASSQDICLLYIVCLF